MRKMDALWAYQEAEVGKAQLENEIRSTPSRVQLNRLHKQLKAQQATIAKLGESLEAYEKQLAKLDEQTGRLEDRLGIESGELATMRQDDESTAEEMTELRGDIERLGREIAQGVREARALLADIEKAIEEYQATRTAASKAKREYDALRAVCEKEREERTGELARHEAAIALLAKSVEPALLARYQKVKTHHAVPIARVVHQKCGGCNMSLPMVMLKRIATTDGIVECENCGRILYTEV